MDPDHLNAKPPCYVFLDITGVLYDYPDNAGVMKTVKRLYPLFEQLTEAQKQIALGIAAQEYFKKRAVKVLDKLLLSLSKTHTPYIILSSNWRKNQSVDELQENFVKMNFAKYLFSKTFDSISIEETNQFCNRKIHKHPNCRAAQIGKWLHDNHINDHFVILDDLDKEDQGAHMKKMFGPRCIKIDKKKLLTQAAADAAYRVLTEVRARL